MALLSLNVVSVPPRTTTISSTRTRVPSLPFSFTSRLTHHSTFWFSWLLKDYNIGFCKVPFLVFLWRRLTIRATETDTNNVKSQAPDKAPSKDGSSINQLLGIKGAAQESNKWKIRLQLTKPVTSVYHQFPVGWAGQALFGTLTSDIIVLTLLYSIAGLGIAIVNDFKSVEGDRALGLQSLPVAFGTETAKWICVGPIDITQLSVAGIFFIPPILRYLICIPRFFFVLMYIVLYLEIIHYTKRLLCIFIICGL
ncbi:chlorophyll synthase, chloroplastic [Arachis duranensis]|uniref:Chlorophyll synthase, chloroplastic n=1 Tax=Arachis duranensis TaxID=130453 RepID=A0A9C6TC59_ARADU|nr:chlorophyll synthase, chloroplastic [Arachis duranensis]